MENSINDNNRHRENDNFDCHRETDEERVMRSKSDNIRNHD